MARSQYFVKILQEKVLKDPARVIRFLVGEMNIGAAAMKLALSEDLRNHSYKRYEGQLLTKTARKKRIKKG